MFVGGRVGNGFAQQCGGWGITPEKCFEIEMCIITFLRIPNKKLRELMEKQRRQISKPPLFDLFGKKRS